MKFLLAVLAIILTPVAALGHTDVSETSGVIHGFMHPLVGMDHVLAMVSVGLLAYTLGRRALWMVPLAFVGMMAFGGLLGTADVNIPFVELGIGLSIIVIGMAAALGPRIPVAAAIALVGTFAIFHGVAHGAEMPIGISGLAYAAGFMLATALLHIAGIAACFGCAKLIGNYGHLVARIGGALAAILGVAIVGGAV